MSQIQVPKGWEVTRIGDFCKVIRGSSPRPKGDTRYFGGNVPWIKISDITSEKGKYVSSTKEGLTSEGVLKSRFHPLSTREVLERVEKDIQEHVKSKDKHKYVRNRNGYGRSK